MSRDSKRISDSTKKKAIVGVTSLLFSAAGCAAKNYQDNPIPRAALSSLLVIGKLCKPNVKGGGWGLAVGLALSVLAVVVGNWMNADAREAQQKNVMLEAKVQQLGSQHLADQKLIASKDDDINKLKEQDDLTKKQLAEFQQTNSQKSAENLALNQQLHGNAAARFMASPRARTDDDMPDHVDPDSEITPSPA